MSAQTRLHRHWHVKVRSGGKVHRVLTYPLVWTTREYAERSRLPWGMDQHTGLCRLTALGLLHRVTGLTLEVRR